MSGEGNAQKVLIFKAVATTYVNTLKIRYILYILIAKITDSRFQNPSASPSRVDLCRRFDSTYNII